MNTEWKNAILAEIRNNPGVTSAGLIERLSYGWVMDKQEIYRDLYTLEKQGEIMRTDDKPKRCYIATSEPEEVWVVADDVGSCKYLTAGKAYHMTIFNGSGGYITDNDGDEIYLHLPSCYFIDGKPWRIVPKPEIFATPETKAFVDFMESEVFDYVEHDDEPDIECHIDTLTAKVDELTTWKANAIAKHPDLVDDPLIIQAREILADHYPHECVPIRHGQWDKKVIFTAVFYALTMEPSQK